MKDQHKMIKGYRDLNENEIAAMNALKEREAEILTILQDLKDSTPESINVDQRWLAIGKTHIEQGFMAVIRAIARPNIE